MKRFFILIFLCIPFRIHADQEFIYPVGHSSFGGGLKIYLIYQKNENNIELFVWDPELKTINKSLSSRFNPGNVTMLPDDSGFSFIDDGIVWVKSFMKRSPSTLSSTDPIYAHELLHWIDGTSFYTSARQNNYFTVVQCDHDGEVDIVVALPEVDCLYPQKIDRQLFYIERLPIRQGERESYNYSIMKTFYPKIIHSHFRNMALSTEDFEQEVKKIIKHDFDIDKSIAQKIYSVLPLGQKPAMFLSMISEKEGFFIEYPAKIKKTDREISCIYHHIIDQDGIWQQSPLFTFGLPTSLIPNFFETNSMGPRLYESILRLVPVYSENHNGIFYTDFTAQSVLGLFFFDLSTHQKKRISPINTQKNFFSPIFVEGKLLYGGTIDTNRFADIKGTEKVPYMWEDDNSEVYLEMPSY